MERLRLNECSVNALCYEAAHAIKQRDAEIERLRAALKAALDILTTCSSCSDALKEEGV